MHDKPPLIRARHACEVRTATAACRRIHASWLLDRAWQLQSWTRRAQHSPDSELALQAQLRQGRVAALRRAVPGLTDPQIAFMMRSPMRCPDSTALQEPSQRVLQEVTSPTHAVTAPCMILQACMPGCQLQGCWRPSSLLSSPCLWASGWARAAAPFRHCSGSAGPAETHAATVFPG